MNENKLVRSKLVFISILCLLLALLGSALPLQASSGGSSGSVAPGGPGAMVDWTPANKEGFGTARSHASKVWYTLQDGRLTEVYYPDLSTPSVRDLEFIVSDGHSFAELAFASSTHLTQLVDSSSLIYQQVDTEQSGRWRLTITLRQRHLLGYPARRLSSFDWPGISPRAISQKCRWWSLAAMQPVRKDGDERVPAAIIYGSHTR